MANIRYFVFLLLGLPFFIIGCETENIHTKDGTVPPELVEYVQSYLGDYHGQFNANKGVMVLSLQDNRLTAQFTDHKGAHELLWPSCKSKIGQLKYIRIEREKTNPVTALHFDFEGNACVLSQYIEFWPKIKETNIELYTVIRAYSPGDEGPRNIQYHGEFNKPL